MHVYNNLTETLLYFQFNKIKPVESIIFRNVWYSISPPELREKNQCTFFILWALWCKVSRCNSQFFIRFSDYILFFFSSSPFVSISQFLAGLQIILASVSQDGILYWCSDINILVFSNTNMAPYMMFFKLNLVRFFLNVTCSLLNKTHI